VFFYGQSRVSGFYESTFSLRWKPFCATMILLAIISAKEEEKMIIGAQGYTIREF
jgi:hypothetical protein